MFGGDLECVAENIWERDEPYRVFLRVGVREFTRCGVYDDADPGSTWI